MCRSPNAYHRNARQRCQMHIGRVHREHHIEVAHQYQFLTHVLQLLAYIDALLELLAPLVEILLFLLSAPKEKNMGVGVLLRQLRYHQLHQRGRINLAFMGCKRSNADEWGVGCWLLTISCWQLVGNCSRQQAQVTATCREDARKLDIDGIAQAR